MFVFKVEKILIIGLKLQFYYPPYEQQLETAIIVQLFIRRVVSLSVEHVRKTEYAVACLRIILRTFDTHISLFGEEQEDTNFICCM